MERGSLVAKTVLSGRKLTEVSSGFRNDIIKELEDDAASGLIVNRDIELQPDSQGCKARTDEKGTYENVRHGGI